MQISPCLDVFLRAFGPSLLRVCLGLLVFVEFSKVVPHAKARRRKGGASLTRRVSLSLKSFNLSVPFSSMRQGVGEDVDVELFGAFDFVAAAAAAVGAGVFGVV